MTDTPRIDVKLTRPFDNEEYGWRVGVFNKDKSDVQIFTGHSEQTLRPHAEPDTPQSINFQVVHRETGSVIVTGIIGVITGDSNDVSCHAMDPGCTVALMGVKSVLPAETIRFGGPVERDPMLFPDLVPNYYPGDPRITEFAHVMKGDPESLWTGDPEGINNLERLALNTLADFILRTDPSLKENPDQLRQALSHLGNNPYNLYMYHHPYVFDEPPFFRIVDQAEAGSSDYIAQLLTCGADRALERYTNATVAKATGQNYRDGDEEMQFLMSRFEQFGEDS